MKQRNYRNLMQNVVITFLSVSAVLLFMQTQLTSLVLPGSYDESARAASPTISAAPAEVLTAPVRAAVTGAYGRYSGVTLTTASESFADPLGRRLLEALGSARDYTACAGEDFLRALEGPSLYYDFWEPLPLSVLAALLGGGEETAPREDLSARRLLIVPQDSGTILYLWDGGDACFRAATAVSADSLSQVISLYEVDGTSFALDGQEELDPCSLLPGAAPELPAFAMGTPLASTDWLLSALGFHPRSQTRHTESNGTELIMDGDRVLRIRPDGSVYYQSGDEPALQITTAGETPTLREAALGAGSLLGGLIDPVSGEAQLYLQNLRRNGDTVVLRFGYQAAGVPVCFQDNGFAAEVTLTGNAVTALTLRFRQYNPLEEASLLLPLPQALAVAASSPGTELFIGYAERNGECRACWLCD